MVESKLIFLTEVELPPYCFLSEVVEWIALGRVPQMQHHFDSKVEDVVDYRFFWREMPDNFQPTSYYPWFDRLEFESLGIPVTDAYFAAVEAFSRVDVCGLPGRISEYEQKEEVYIDNGREPAFGFYARMIAEGRKNLEELGPLQVMVDKVDAGFQPHLEVAWAKLFQLLVLGKIFGEAIDLERWERLAGANEYKSAARFENLPPSAFYLGLNWIENEILVQDKQHVALRLNTQDILDHWSTLWTAGSPITVERFGAFYSSRAEGRNTQQAKRGRRPVVDWRILKGHLSELASLGELPDGKENCIYELIVFAERELGKGPSRSAIQRNMGAELDAHYAQK